MSDMQADQTGRRIPAQQGLARRMATYCRPCDNAGGRPLAKASRNVRDDVTVLRGLIDYLVEASFAEICATLVVTRVEQEIYVDHTHRHAALRLSHGGPRRT